MPKHDLPTWDDLARKVADLERYQDQPHLRAKYDEDAEFVVQLALVLQTGEVEPKHIQLRSKLGPAWNLILGIAEELYTSAVHQRSGISQNLVAVEDFYNERRDQRSEGISALFDENMGGLWGTVETMVMVYKLRSKDHGHEMS